MAEPIYKQIEQYVLDLIKTNKLKQGDFIPTEVQLSEQFKVTRMTVRSALNNLVNEGYIVRQRGVGSRVRDPKLIDNIGKVRGFTEEMRRKGCIVSNELVSLKLIEVDEVLNQRLKVSENEQVWEIKRVRLADGKRVSYMITYMPVKLFPHLTEADCHGSLYEFVQHACSERIFNAEREVQAVISEEEVMKRLKIEDVQPILYIEQSSSLSNGQVFEFSQTYHLGYTLTLVASAVV